MKSSLPNSKERLDDSDASVSGVGLTSTSKDLKGASTSESVAATTSSVGDEQYTFDLFIAVAMLIQMRKELFHCNGKS